ncbi:MAG TPA: hypothetical protein VGK38_07460 [Prolixibacteraceae bacterium]|jgi:uncharacterized protein YuzB (UPF0349 family)
MKKDQAYDFSQIHLGLIRGLADAFKALLENYHLYQNYDVVFPDLDLIMQSIGLNKNESRYSMIKDRYQPIYEQCINFKWEVISPTSNMNRGGYYVGEVTEFDPCIHLISPTIKTYCSKCGRIEPYNLIHGENVINSELPGPVIVQVFFLTYQCQSCKGVPEVFLVRREGMSLSIDGHSPIEFVTVEKYTPKQFRKYISGAIVAKNSGEVLAGNFLLRTFIEQYVRSLSKTPRSENMQELFAEYSKDLPISLKERFASLNNIYDKLSEDIHFALGSKETFDKALADINEHFDAKRLYKLIAVED